jgi:type I restriction enzyme M protein
LYTTDWGAGISKNIEAKVAFRNDPERELDNIVQLVPAGKIRCFITGVLRPDKPEENIRQRWARSLVEEYRYNKSDIALEFPIKMGVAKKKADIVVFREGAPRKQENIFIVVEAKREDILPRAHEEGVEQLKSYMAAASTCKYGLWVGSERQGFEKTNDGSIVEGLADIPSKGELEPRVPAFTDLSPAVELKSTFRRCHNYIYANQGLQKAEAFHEMLKLIFCKVFDETESDGDLKFFIRSGERRSEAGQRRVLDERIAPLFEAVKERYPYIFKANEEITLSKRVLAYIVSELQRISLLRTQTDVKGTAYEELVGDNLRGDRGEYFTPRNVCDMSVEMAVSLFTPARLTTLKVLDTCCGTGGFLVSYINYLRKVFTAQEGKKGGSEEEVRQRVSSRIKELCAKNVFGTDINPFLVRTCQMNLVMHGDGSANIFPADAIVSPAEWEDEAAAKAVGYGKFDMVITNPPFGGKAIIDDPHVLAKYDLSTYESRNPRSSLPAEQLFVETAMKFLKPGGRLAIVLPDSILNNPGLQFIRSWLLRRARIVGTIDLPKETFAHSGGVPNPSVLVLQKYTNTEIKLAEAGALEYEIFMAIPKTAGIDKRGNPVYQRTPEGFDLEDENCQPILDDEISLVAPKFSRWVKDMGYVGD